MTTLSSTYWPCSSSLLTVAFQALEAQGQEVTEVLMHPSQIDDHLRAWGVSNQESPCVFGATICGWDTLRLNEIEVVSGWSGVARQFVRILHDPQGAK